MDRSTRSFQSLFVGGLSSKMAQKNFIVCTKCEKNLIERRQNEEGEQVLFFAFGRNPDGRDFMPVQIEISGDVTVKMKCLRRHCRKENPDHWNIIKL